jgi:hypothetical protein
MANGRCRLHGGATPSGPASAQYRHGRYAAVFKGQLSAHFDQAVSDSNPLDLLPELAVQRTLLSQYIGKVSDRTNVKAADVERISELASDVVRTATMIAKVRNDTALTIAEIRFIQEGILRLLEKYVPDPDQRRSFVSELRGLIPARTDAEDNRPEFIPAGAETPGGHA